MILLYFVNNFSEIFAVISRIQGNEIEKGKILLS